MMSKKARIAEPDLPDTVKVLYSQQSGRRANPQSYCCGINVRIILSNLQAPIAQFLMKSMDAGFQPGEVKKA